jgi:mRNA interferase MazF
MGKFIAGDIVVTTFPFSDLSAAKRRPALVLAEVEFGDLILCQITSKPYSSKSAILISSSDFAKGALPLDSYIRPDKLFTAEPALIEKTAGSLRIAIFRKIQTKVRDIFNS